MTERMFWIETANRELWIAPEIADLVAGFIPRYLEIDPSQREPARRAFAAAVSKAVQQKLFVAALACRAVDVATVADYAVDRMLGYGDAHDRTPWDFVVPLLVLGGSDDEWTPPAGNVVVVDARRDGALILSLAAIGEIRSLGLLSGPALMPHPLGL